MIGVLDARTLLPIAFILMLAFLVAMAWGGYSIVLSNSQRDINKKLEDLTTEVQKIKKQNPDLNEMD